MRFCFCRFLLECATGLYLVFVVVLHPLHIKGLIEYVENSEKTVLNEDMQDFFDVFSLCKKSVKNK